MDKVDISVKLFDSSSSLLRKLIESALEGHLCIRGDFPEQFGVVRDGNRLYLHRNWVVETILLNHFARLMKAVPQPLDLPDHLVLKSIATQSLLLVNGGPGTGKTTAAVQLIRAVPHLRIKIAAPTGKAAERLGGEATTLHRLLRLSPGRHRLFEENKIDADLIIVDEASMVDASLFAHLLAAIPDGARLVLLGDADQLPPVQGGGVFSDLCALSSLTLHHCHRTQTLQTIYEAARKGDVEPLLPLLEPLPDDPVSIVANERDRVLCPLRKGPLGVDALNRAVLQRKGKERAPILITGNNPNLNLYNGTEGVVKGLEVLFPDGRALPLAELPDHEFAFALSVHKSQGSEYEEVLCLLPPGSEEFGRKALYTAVTRAKKRVRFLGSRKTLEEMLAKESRQENGIRERFTLLQLS